MALMIVGTEEAYKSINREGIRRFLINRKLPSGAFELHSNGEVDIRGAYTATAVAYALNILDEEVRLNVMDYISSC